MTYRQRPESIAKGMPALEVEAEQWTGELVPDTKSGVGVEAYNAPGVNGDSPCPKCGKPFKDHGWLGRGVPIHPGGFIVTLPGGERRSMTAEQFHAVYEAAE